MTQMNADLMFTVSFKNLLIDFHIKETNYMINDSCQQLISWHKQQEYTHKDSSMIPHTLHLYYK